MSDRTLRLLLIDSDPIFRKGLRTIIEEFPDLQVVAEAEVITTALQLLASAALAIDLVILEPIDSLQSSQLSLQLRQLKTQYQIPILLLSSIQEPTFLVVARQAGIEGYCSKGISVTELVAAIRQVAAGQLYWTNESTQQPSIFAIVRHRWRSSGLAQIELVLAEVTAQLQTPGLPVLERAFLAGQRRELLASRWLVNRLLAAPESRGRGLRGASSLGIPPLRGKGDEGRRSQSRAEVPSVETGVQGVPSRAIAQIKTTGAIRIQADLFDSISPKLQLSLQNVTDVPLEIDIFREEKKRELLNLILQKISNILDELRFSQIQVDQLPELQPVILRDLWQAVTTEFFGKYLTLRIRNRHIEIVNLLLQDVLVVQTQILDKIPLVADLFSYLLFQTPLVIDNISYPSNSLEAKERAELILQNLIIQVGNSVVQPLLNQFADVEGIKQSFYDRSLISTREIEQFRNNLSWKYRLNSYVTEPKAIFESRYQLFVLASRGIAKVSIYAPRSQELTQLSGIELAVTLALEIRDAIAPRIRATVAFIGNGVVYILTQVIGRAIGLIGRGILQGIGGSPDKFGRNSERTK